MPLPFAAAAAAAAAASSFTGPILGGLSYIECGSRKTRQLTEIRVILSLARGETLLVIVPEELV